MRGMQVRDIRGSLKEAAAGVIDVKPVGENDFKLTLNWTIDTDRGAFLHAEELTVHLRNPPADEKLRLQMVLIAVKTYRRTMKSAAQKGSDDDGQILQQEKITGFKNSHFMKVSLPSEQDIQRGNYKARVINPHNDHVEKELDFGVRATAHDAGGATKDVRIAQQAQRIYQFLHPHAGRGPVPAGAGGQPFAEVHSHVPPNPLYQAPPAAIYYPPPPVYQFGPEFYQQYPPPVAFDSGFVGMPVPSAPPEEQPYSVVPPGAPPPSEVHSRAVSIEEEEEEIAALQREVEDDEQRLLAEDQALDRMEGGIRDEDEAVDQREAAVREEDQAVDLQEQRGREQAAQIRAADDHPAPQPPPRSPPSTGQAPLTHKQVGKPISSPLPRPPPLNLPPGADPKKYAPPPERQLHWTRSPPPSDSELSSPRSVGSGFTSPREGTYLEVEGEFTTQITDRHVEQLNTRIRDIVEKETKRLGFLQTRIKREKVALTQKDRDTIKQRMQFEPLAKNKNIQKMENDALKAKRKAFPNETKRQIEEIQKDLVELRSIKPDKTNYEAQQRRYDELTEDLSEKLEKLDAYITSATGMDNINEKF
jgi:hypothetical protein